jgi:hypothetical protein
LAVPTRQHAPTSGNQRSKVWLPSTVTLELACHARACAAPLLPGSLQVLAVQLQHRVSTLRLSQPRSGFRTSELRGLVSCRNRLGFSSSRGFPSQESWSPSDATSSLAVRPQLLPVSPLEPYHRRFERRPPGGPGSCRFPPPTMGSLSAPSSLPLSRQVLRRFPVPPGSGSLSHRLGLTSSASKPCSSSESVRTTQSCP